MPRLKAIRFENYTKTQELMIKKLHKKNNCEYEINF